MKDFHELTWSEGAEAILALLPRLTVMRDMLDDGPVKELRRCAEALVEGDIREAVDAVFAMTGELLCGDFRRVTGELMKDYLLHSLLIKPHPFAKMAAANRLDEAMYNAMKEDMDVLYNLRELDGATLYRFIQDRYKELRQKARPNRDSATRLAEAAWGGSAVRPAPEENPAPLPNLPAFLPAGAPQWHYGEEELRDSYTADEALEEMYHRFLESELDWSTMVEDIWNFFAAYGCGAFLKNRLFVWRRGRLCPMEDARYSEAFPLMEDEYRVCLDHAIAFMRGDSAEPLLLTGGEGMGKTTMLFSLADELPEMRFVYVPELKVSGELAPLFDALKDQPLKFMVAADDVGGTDFAMRTLPANVLLAAAADAEVSLGAFTKRVSLEMPRLDGFAEMVMRLLEADGINLPRETVRSACVDHQVDSKGELTVAAAVAVANALKK